MAHISVFHRDVNVKQHSEICRAANLDEVNVKNDALITADD
jgi:hypothetical protein